VRLLALVLALAGLPDLDQAAPAAVSVRVEDGRRLLVFGSAVQNVGTGALVVVGERRGRTMVARQVVGGRRVTVGTMAYVRAETHAHWHYLGFERYELRTTGGRLVRAAPKQGFCLGDRYRLPATPPGATYTGECGRNRPGLRALRTGISVGWGDDYVPRLEGQSIDLAGVRDGRYVLVHRVDPGRRLVQRTRRNDAASALVELRDGQARVLVRCPDSGTCAG
jgi:hypothetical protein